MINTMAVCLVLITGSNSTVITVNSITGISYNSLTNTSNILANNRDRTYFGVKGLTPKQVLEQIENSRCISK